MTLQTNITGFRGPEELAGKSTDGYYVHGLYLEGAGWELGSGGNEGYLTSAKPKDLHPALPVVNVVAVPLKEKKTLAQYVCPVYITSQRGPTYVFTANLQMESEESDPKDWVLAGVALLMAEE